MEQPMRAVLNTQPVALQDVSLDDFGWDSPQTFGPLSLMLTLDITEFGGVGQTIWDYAQTCRTDEPDYFDSAYMQDVPIPTSPRMFVDNPHLIAVYLEDSFWTREMVLALLDVLPRYIPNTRARYLIQDFRRILIDEHTVHIEFGAVHQYRPVVPYRRDHI
jgi:hypothetical protein